MGVVSLLTYAVGDPNTSVCGGPMGGLAQNRGIRGMVVDGAGREEETRYWFAQGKTIEDLLNEFGRI